MQTVTPTKQERNQEETALPPAIAGYTTLALIDSRCAEVVGDGKIESWTEMRQALLDIREVIAGARQGGEV